MVESVARELPGNFLSRESHLHFKLREYIDVVTANADRVAHLNEDSITDSSVSRQF